MIRPTEAQVKEFTRELRRDVLPERSARWFECEAHGLLERDEVAQDEDGFCCVRCLSPAHPSDVF